MADTGFKVDVEVDMCRDICKEYGSFRDALRHLINNTLEERKEQTGEELPAVDIEKILEEASVQFTVHDIRFTIRVR